MASNLRYYPYHHLRTQRDFETTYGKGTKVYSTMFSLFLCENNLEHPRLGLSVRKKYGSAPQRNLFKRHLREIFRHSQDEIFPPVDIIVIPGRDSAQADYAELEKHFRKLVGLS